MTSPTRSTRTTRILLFVAVLICLIIGLFLGYRYFRRGQDYMGRPLVLITSPTNGERVALGRAVPAVALARAESGITRMELWAEGAIVATQESPDGEALSPMTISAGWSPATQGPHTITARAFTARGLAGYASVNVEVIPPETALGSHTVAEGESLESIAATYGVGADELAGLNPELPAGGPAPGSELVVPLDGLPSDDAAAPEPPSGAAPETPADLLPLQLLGSAHELSRSAILRLEAISLETRAGYESLHCYASLGDQQPVWYPDTDNNPATDESFSALTGTEWDIASHFSGRAAPMIFWPSDQSLPFDIACVGVRLGGADAVKLGRLALSVPPADWDGQRRRARAEDEGGFVLEYMISFVEMEPKGLDTGMAAPVNLHYDDRRQELHWDYTPHTEPEAEPAIDGFLIFLDDNLVWEVDADDRQSRLPEEWLNPPCGESYDFTVRAFHRPYPDGAYSEPSNTVSIAGPEEGSEACNRQFVVTFRRLTTYDMGGDRDDDPGDQGPIYGWTVVNGEVHGFGEDRSTGIFNNSSYGLDTFFWDDYSRANTYFVTLQEDEELSLSFNLWDEDSGWRQRNDEICSNGTGFFYSRLLSGAIEDYFDAAPSGSSDVNCRIEYTIGPAPGSPMGVAGGGLLLPWLDLTDVTVDRASGQLQLHITNTGSAAWANHDLDVRVTNRAGEETGAHTWPLFYLDALDDVVLQHPSLTADSPEAACVHLDYNDRVLESLESNGMLYHGAVCPSLPDLIVEEVQYERDDSQLQVIVRNTGNGAIEDRVMSVDLLRPDGSSITTPFRPTVALLEHAQSMAIPLPIDPDVRRVMLQGYTVHVNRDGQLLEEDPNNNEFTVPAGETVWVVFHDSLVTVFYRDWIPWWADYPVHHFVISFSVTVAGGESSVRIGHWSQDFDWEPTTDDDRHHEDCGDCSTEQVAVGGDERVLLGAAASVRKQASATREDLGSWSNPFDILDPDLTREQYYGTTCIYGQQGYHEALTEGMDHTAAGGYVFPRDWGVSYCVYRLRE